MRKEILSLETDPRSPERGQYRFVQALMRGVAYETLSRRDRKARHLLAAEHLGREPEADGFAAVLAQHLLDAREAMPDDADAAELVGRAVGLLERAAARAHSLGSPSHALRHYLSALPWAADPTTTGRLAVGAASAALAAGRSSEALDLAKRAVAAYDEAGRRIDSAYALSVVGECVNNVGAVGDMPEELAAVYDSLVEDDESRQVLARLAQQIARGHFAGRGDAATGAVWADRATALAEAEEDALLLAESMSGYAAMLMTTRRPTMGLGILRVALDVAREHDLPRAQLGPLNNLASFLAGRDLAKARAYAEEGLALAGRLGDADTGGYLTGTAALVYWQSGSWDELLALENAGTDLFHAVVTGVYRGLTAQARGEEVQEIDSPDGMTAVQMRAGVLAVRALSEIGVGDDRAALASALRTKCCSRSSRQRRFRRVRMRTQAATSTSGRRGGSPGARVTGRCPSIPRTRCVFTNASGPGEATVRPMARSCRCGSASSSSTCSGVSSGGGGCTACPSSPSSWTAPSRCSVIQRGSVERSASSSSG